MSFFEKVFDMLGLYDNEPMDENYGQGEYGVGGNSSNGGSTFTQPQGLSFQSNTDSMLGSTSSSSNDFDQTFGSSLKGGAFKSSPKITTFNSEQIKMIVINPDQYDEAREICDYIKSKKPVVVNLESMDFENAQRVMDFLSGSCYSLNGSIQRVAKNIFIVAPDNIDVTSDFKSEYKGKNSSLSWMSFNKQGMPQTGASAMPNATSTNVANQNTFGMRG